jgi:hypothetical protein
MGALEDAEKQETGFVCQTCHHETNELPAGLVAIRFDYLRHSAVSRMIAAGVPLPIIAKIVDGQQERWRRWQCDTGTSARKN